MIVALLFLLPIVGLLVYEFWALFTGHKLVTEYVREWFKAYPPMGVLVGFIVGLLMGHFFWYF